MRVLVHAVDGLEYDFIEPRDFPNLKQKQHFRVGIPRECLSCFEEIGEIPWTPTVWASILTGMLPEEHGLTKDKYMKWKSKRRQFIMRNLNKVRLFFGLRKINFLLDESRTFLNLAGNPIVIQYPISSLKWSRGGKWTTKGITTDPSRFSPEDILSAKTAVFHRLKKETLERIDEDWDFFFTYCKIIDVVSHLYWGRGIVETYYRMVEEYTREIKEALPEQTLMLVISDHGSEPMKGVRYAGMHSDHAFASVNHDVRLSASVKVTDFYDVVVENLLIKRAHTREMSERLTPDCPLAAI